MFYDKNNNGSTRARELRESPANVVIAHTGFKKGHQKSRTSLHTHDKYRLRRSITIYNFQYRELNSPNFGRNEYFC